MSNPYEPRVTPRVVHLNESLNPYGHRREIDMTYRPVSPQTSPDAELLHEILSAPIVFWTCPSCPSPRVKWVNNCEYAICLECGRTSRDGKE